MGWAERGWYLGPQKAALFDRAGNAGPTVWWDGRIVGGWTQHTDGEIVWRVLDDIGAEGRRAVERQVDRLQAWLDGDRRRRTVPDAPSRGAPAVSTYIP